MATSGSYDWNINRTEIIESALRKIGGLGDWESATSQQLAKSVVALNAMIKAWQADGMPQWAIARYDVLAGDLATGSAVIGVGAAIPIAKPLKVLKAMLLQGTGDDAKERPIDIYERDRFYSLTNRAMKGTPNIIYYQPLIDTGILHCYPIPNATVIADADKVVIHYQAMYQDMDSSADNVGFPGEWIEALIYGLAVRMAPEYGLSINERNQLTKEAEAAKNLALSFGTEEGSIFVQPA